MIRYYATSLDKSDDVPTLAKQMWLKPMQAEMQPVALADATLVVLVIQTADSYLFNEADFALIERSKLPVVILDYFERLVNPAPYAQLFEAIKKLQVVGWFRRELETGYEVKGCPVWPLDFTVKRVPAYDSIATREEFDRRPVDILMAWGYSNLDRVALHGGLMVNFEHFQAGPPPAPTIEDVEYILAKGQTCAMALICTPHYRRLPIEKLYWLQSKAKISISLFGNGMKCFRSAEAGYNSVSAHQAPEMVQWAYPWLDQHNCITLENQPGSYRLDLAKAVEKLRYWTVVDHGALYTLYLNGFANNQHYVSDVYGRDYLLPRIKEALTLCVT